MEVGCASAGLCSPHDSLLRCSGQESTECASRPMLSASECSEPNSCIDQCGRQQNTVECMAMPGCEYNNSSNTCLGIHDVSISEFDQIHSLIMSTEEREEFSHTGLQDMAIQQYGGLCVLAGHIPYNNTSELWILPGRIPLGTVPMECRPACCMNLFNGIATAELCADGSLMLTSTMDTDIINLNGIAWSPRRVQSEQIALSVGSSFGLPYMVPQFDRLDHTSGALCALSGVLQFDVSSGEDAVEISTLPAECTVFAQTTRVANVQFKSASSSIWQYPWPAVGTLTFATDGAVSLSLGDNMPTADVIRFVTNTYDLESAEAVPQAFPGWHSPPCDNKYACHSASHTRRWMVACQ